MHMRDKNGQFVKGHKGIGNVFQKGHLTNLGRILPSTRGENHFRWKGRRAGYRAFHAWVTYHRGSPKKCEHCGTTDAKQFNWSNKSHEYKRELDDWIRLCPKCAMAYDKKYWGIATKLFGKLR